VNKSLLCAKARRQINYHVVESVYTREMLKWLFVFMCWKQCVGRQQPADILTGTSGWIKLLFIYIAATYNSLCTHKDVIGSIMGNMKMFCLSFSHPPTLIKYMPCCDGQWNSFIFIRISECQWAESLPQTSVSAWRRRNHSIGSLSLHRHSRSVWRLQKDGLYPPCDKPRADTHIFQMFSDDNRRHYTVARGGSD